MFVRRMTLCKSIGILPTACFYMVAVGPLGCANGSEHVVVRNDGAPSTTSDGSSTNDGTTGNPCTSDTTCSGTTGTNHCSLDADYTVSVTNVNVGLWPTPICLEPQPAPT